MTGPPQRTWLPVQRADGGLVRGDQLRGDGAHDAAGTRAAEEGFPTAHLAPQCSVRIACPGEAPSAMQLTDTGFVG